MTQLAKGAMMRLGVTPAGGQPRPAHIATFDIDEEALPVGVAVLAEAARRFVTGQFQLD
jgi:metal-dependent amidase/aminoacylase/carboxypeptidase family protein